MAREKEAQVGNTLKIAVGAFKVVPEYDANARPRCSWSKRISYHRTKLSDGFHARTDAQESWKPGAKAVSQ